MCHKNEEKYIDLAKCEPVLEDTKDYLDSASHLYTLIKLNNKGLPESMDHVFPYIVLSSYCIESGLKNILIIKKIAFPKDHNLKRLFNFLPQDVKDLIYFYPNMIWNSMVFQESVEACFKKCLAKAKNNFIEARYFFEKKNKKSTFCLPFLNDLSNCLYELLLEIFREEEKNEKNTNN